jgi:hypothetical protein
MAERHSAQEIMRFKKIAPKKTEILAYDSEASKKSDVSDG